jgi:uncharacterized glyoxalase superfamily protein PhnB
MSDQRPSPVLNQLNLVVKDVAATLQFYRLIGIETEASPPEWAAHHVAARLPNGVNLEFDSTPFASQWNPGWGRGSGGGVMFFRVPVRDDVDRIYSTVVSAGHRSQQPPVDAFWGARYAIVEDPDGNSVGIMSPSDPARRTPPPPPPLR